MRRTISSSALIRRQVIMTLAVFLTGTLSVTAFAQETPTQEPDQLHSEQSAAAVQQPTYIPDPDRPAQPPGRPTLEDPFEPVAGQNPYVTTPYGGYITHSDEYQCEPQGCHSYYALDFSLPNGQSFPVAAAAGGTLTYLTGTEAGNTVFINHGNGWKTKYGHLPDNGVTVRGQTIQKGESIQVSAGEVFATSGKTGADSIHLHFELRATYWPRESERTWSTTWSYPPYELYGTSAELYPHISDGGNSEEFVTEDPGLINNPIGNDTVSSLDVPRVPKGDLADQQIVSLYEHTYYSFGRCVEFSEDDPDLRDNSIGNDSVSSIRVGVPCPSAATPAPKSLSVKALNPTSIELRWSAPTTPTGYAVYEAEKSLKDIVRGNINSYTISGLQPGSEHCYYVYAFYTAGSSEIQWGCAKTPTS